MVGVDIGATKISAGLVGPDGRIRLHGGRSIHANDGPTAVLAGVVDVVERLVEPPARPRAVGVGVAAQVERGSGRVLYAPNLRWHDLPLADRLGKALGCPVTIENDVRAATVGEWRHGAGAGRDDLLTLWVGTGIGGSVVSGGRLLEGSSNALGEIGHMVVVAGGRRCHCPGRGCLEAYAGGWAIAERARERIASEPELGRPMVGRATSPEALTAAIVTAAARDGDPLAVELMRSTSGYLAAGAVSLVNAFNPELLVVGGGVVEGWPEALGAMASAIRNGCQPPAAAAVRVVPAALGPDAVIVGAGRLAHDRLLGAERAGRPAPRTKRGGHP